MDRTLTIHNVLCHEDLQITIPVGAVLITGENSAGKSSVARILAAVTTHNTNPACLSAAFAKTYLKKGCIEGTAALSDGATWIVPSKMEIPAGVEPETGVHMAGVVNFIEHHQNAEARAKVFEDIFLPPDADALLRPLWKQSEQQLQSVLKLIAAKGWKAAHGVYDEQKKDSGRQWGRIAGIAYTKKRGSQWRPADWSTDIEGLSEDDVLTALTEAQDALRAVGVRQAVDQDRVDRGIAARDVLVPKQELAASEAKERAKDAEAEPRRLNSDGTAARQKIKLVGETITRLECALKEIDRLQKGPAGPPHRCPWCAKGIMALQGGAASLALVRAEDAKPVDHKKLAAMQAGSQEEMDEANRERAALVEKFKTLGTAYEDARLRHEELVAAHNQELGRLTGIPPSSQGRRSVAGRFQ